LAKRRLRVASLAGLALFLTGFHMGGGGVVPIAFAFADKPMVELISTIAPSTSTTTTTTTTTCICNYKWMSVGCFATCFDIEAVIPGFGGVSTNIYAKPKVGLISTITPDTSTTTTSSTTTTGSTTTMTTTTTTCFLT
jgi:hypothetical protein